MGELLVRVVQVGIALDLSIFLHVLELLRLEELAILSGPLAVRIITILLFDLIALLVQNLDLLDGSLKECFKEYLLVDLFFDRQIDLLLAVGAEVALLGPYRLAKLAEVLPPEAKFPRFIVRNHSDALHSAHSDEAWVLEDRVFVHLNYCPDADCLLGDFHLFELEFVVV